MPGPIRSNHGAYRTSLALSNRWDGADLFASNALLMSLFKCVQFFMLEPLFANKQFSCAHWREGVEVNGRRSGVPQQRLERLFMDKAEADHVDQMSVARLLLRALKPCHR
jgi:hypothetical protein